MYNTQKLFDFLKEKGMTDIHKVISSVAYLCHDIPGGKAGKLEYLLKRLEDIEVDGKPLLKVLGSNQGSVSYEEGISVIDELLEEPGIIGLSGMPGTGKTEILNKYRSCVLTIDEFWNPDYRHETDYSEKRKTALEEVSKGNPVMVAGLLLEQGLLKNNIHLVSENRYMNNLVRIRVGNLDIDRVSLWPYHNLSEKLCYDIVRFDADLIMRGQP